MNGHSSVNLSFFMLFLMTVIKRFNIAFALSKFHFFSLPMVGVELTSMKQTVENSSVLFSVGISQPSSSNISSSELLALCPSSTRGSRHVVLYRYGSYWTMSQHGQQLCETILLLTGQTGLLESVWFSLSTESLSY